MPFKKIENFEIFKVLSLTEQILLAHYGSLDTILLITIFPYLLKVTEIFEIDKIIASLYISNLKRKEINIYSQKYKWQ